jgi:predicted ester cyclase
MTDHRVLMAMEANKALARRWFDSASYRDELAGALENGDPKIARESFFRSLIAEVFSPDCIMHFPDGIGSADRVLRYHLVMMDAFPDLSFEIDDMVAEGDKLAVRGRMLGTNTGSFQGMPPTGKHVVMGFITLCLVRQGRIVETWGYNDMPGFLRQLGADPGRAPRP